MVHGIRGRRERTLGSDDEGNSREHLLKFLLVVRCDTYRVDITLQTTGNVSTRAEMRKREQSSGCGGGTHLSNFISPLQHPPDELHSNIMTLRIPTPPTSVIQSCPISLASTYRLYGLLLNIPLLISCELITVTAHLMSFP
jgi:hypothetical protein